jgi:hypothetical protein
MGRATQGVRLIKLDESDSIAAITNIVNGKLTFNPEEDGELGAADTSGETVE